MLWEVREGMGVWRFAGYKGSMNFWLVSRDQRMALGREDMWTRMALYNILGQMVWLEN